MELIWITSAEYIGKYVLMIQFNTGEKGVADLQNELDGPVFEPLKDQKYFKKFTLNEWTIEWPNGADMAPEFLYKQAFQKKPVS